MLKWTRIKKCVEQVSFAFGKHSRRFLNCMRRWVLWGKTLSFVAHWWGHMGLENMGWWRTENYACGCLRFRSSSLIFSRNVRLVYLASFLPPNSWCPWNPLETGANVLILGCHVVEILPWTWICSNGVIKCFKRCPIDSHVMVGT